ncbi:MAG: hypothetical protein BJ554DRAFT_221 [Olpidium bornovanus]|uniref:Uncharacterized protein n=1 Tax=Olpidium bornovanus TaxID=278681 RepID=A0A8H8A1L2_9FUNG|nr:MAG: hypothetical protein BJ554DRAFT_221 [Olpidium bornovanus]
MATCGFSADLASDPVLQIIPSSVLALHLLRESLDPQSFWAPYIELLPRRFDIPLWYSLSELEALRGLYAMREAIRLYRNVIRQYWHIRRLLKVRSNFSGVACAAWLSPYDHGHRTAIAESHFATTATKETCNSTGKFYLRGLHMGSVTRHDPAERSAAGNRRRERTSRAGSRLGHVQPRRAAKCALHSVQIAACRRRGGFFCFIRGGRFFFPPFCQISTAFNPERRTLEFFAGRAFNAGEQVRPGRGDSLDFVTSPPTHRRVARQVERNQLWVLPKR